MLFDVFSENVTRPQVDTSAVSISSRACSSNGFHVKRITKMIIDPFDYIFVEIEESLRNRSCLLPSQISRHFHLFISLKQQLVPTTTASLLFITDQLKDLKDINGFTYTKMQKPLFVPSSDEKPQLLTISFADDPQGSLGAQLINCDKVRLQL